MPFFEPQKRGFRKGQKKGFLIESQSIWPQKNRVWATKIDHFGRLKNDHLDNLDDLDGFWIALHWDRFPIDFLAFKNDHLVSKTQFFTVWNPQDMN